jgi:hypothetical protein
MKRIVVGLVDTPSARAALRWAAQQASATGALIEVVTAVEDLPGCWWCETPGTAAAPLITVMEVRAEARAMQGHVLRQEFGSRLTAAPLRATVVTAETAVGLVASAAGADMIAVGRSRRRWRLRRSIGDRCSQLFAGPVVLVPPDDRDGGSPVGSRRSSWLRTSVPDDVYPVTTHEPMYRSA